MSTHFNANYVIHSDAESERLERQARIYGTTDDLEHLACKPTDIVLDAGCGSGAIARTIAKTLTDGKVVGVDREPRYLQFARARAASEGLSNIEFEEADVLRLPFADHTFDVVWSKHLLQWVPQRQDALRELVRVTRPGGRVVCVNSENFCLRHYPTDIEVQTAMEMWFKAADKALGFDPHLGWKLPHMFKTAGLSNIQVDTIRDKAFSGFGGDPEQRWNWGTVFESSFPFTVKVLGSEEAARRLSERVIRVFTNPDVYVHCTLFYVSGTVPLQ